jgi:hypothetical protein
MGIEDIHYPKKHLGRDWLSALHPLPDAVNRHAAQDGQLIYAPNSLRCVPQGVSISRRQFESP